MNRTPKTTIEEWHHCSAIETSQKLGVDPKAGLFDHEAAERLKQHGLNQVSAPPGNPAWRRFLLQFHQPLVYILLGAIVLTALLGKWVDSTVIFTVVLINAIIGFIQEAKAGKAIEALSRMVVTEATVRRQGKRLRLPSSQITIGDVVLLQSGDCVPADLRLTHSNNLQVDESPLTGESLPVQKNADTLKGSTPLADRVNCAFAGTLVTYGQGEGLVVAIGDRTETGRIGRMMAETSEISTPLTKKIAAFSKLLLWLILGLAGLGFAAGAMRGESMIDMFMAAVALAVGTIPEGLPAAVTIVLAIGVNRMAKRKAIIRKLPAVETLGSTTVICSDKTGTLTENQMTVQEIYAGGRTYQLSGGGYNPEGQLTHEDVVINPSKHPALWATLHAGVLCNDSELTIVENKHQMQGDPTEAALLVAGAKGGLIHTELQVHFPRLAMIPFESEHMFRATLHDSHQGRMIYKVGAVERLLPRCDGMLDASGAIVPIDRGKILAEVDSMASKGLRVLAFAQRSTEPDQDHLTHEHVGQELVFLGIQGMIDPPREAVIDAVSRCLRAGVMVKMITGDHIATARAIAQRIGLHQGNANDIPAVTGQELEKIADADLPEVADKTVVFARVAPEQKLRLVRALQTKGHIVAMTGDGVNDAPALKQADIGIAMGISGTDVAKGAADIILTDDNFANIVAAVEEGRGVFDNLRKFIIWTLPTNVGEGGIILVAMLAGFILPVIPVQALWINMTTAIFLGLMIVFEPKEKGTMERPPRPPERPILTYPLFMRTGLVSLIMILGGLWLFFDQMMIQGETIEEARTAVINTIIMAKVAYLFSCRSLNKSLFSIGVFTNPLIWVGSLAMIGIQLIFTYTPFMNQLFHTTAISWDAWLKIGLIALLTFLAVELEIWIRFGRGHENDLSGD